MKIHIFFALIITGITTLQTHAMDDQMILLHAQNYVMRDAGSPFSSHCKKQYDPQIFLDDIWDRIIALCSHEELGNLKETCKQLSVLTSVNRLNTFVMNNFNILGHKSMLFRVIMRTSNPELVTIIMNYAKKEAESLSHPTDAVCINIESLQSMQKPRVRRYATHLMQEALKQDNEIMINRLEEEDYDTELIECKKEILKYEKEAAINYPRLKCGAAILVTALIGACSLIGWVISASPKHTTYHNSTYSPITIPPLNFH